jgi:hypothetical protein
LKKNLFLFLLSLLICQLAYSQKRGISYQAIIADTSNLAGGTPGVLANKNIAFRFTISNGSTVEYEETQSGTTDANGMLNLIIGTGTSTGEGVAHALAGIQWDDKIRMLYVAIDINGGTNFSNISSQELTYAPYALYALTAKPVGIAGGDLSGHFPNPSIAEDAVTTDKLSFGAVTDSKIAPGIDPAKVGLQNVNNTSDVEKPLSKASIEALSAKEFLNNKSNDSTFSENSNIKYPTQKATKIYINSIIAASNQDATNVSKGKLKLAGDLGGTSDLPTVPGLALKATINYVDSTVKNNFVDATTIQKGKIKLAGDLSGTSDLPRIADSSITNTKIAFGINAQKVGLGNVDNTRDSLKPVSKSVKSFLDLKENSANKSKDGSLKSNSDVKYPTEKAVKTYVDSSLIKADLPGLQNALMYQSPTFASTYSWTLKNSAATGSNRDGCAFAVLGDYLFLLGGWHPEKPIATDNEVYRFSDDLTTSKRLKDAPWEGRHAFGCAYQGKNVYVFGGDLNSGHYITDAWKGVLQADTIQWTLQNDSIPWGERILYGSVLHNGSLYVIGGQKSINVADGAFGDVWKSSDEGKTWLKVADGLNQFKKNIYGSITSYNGYIYVIAGGEYYTERTYTNTVWRSRDGIAWEQMPDAPFSARQYTNVVVHDNRIFVLFGNNETLSGNLSDSWTMDINGNWEMIKTGPSERHATAVTSFKGSLTIACGNYFNDAWILKTTDINVPGTLSNVLYKDINTGSISTTNMLSISSVGSFAELQVSNELGFLQTGVEHIDGNRMKGTLAGYSYFGNYYNYGLTFHVNNSLALKIDTAKTATFTGQIITPAIVASQYNISVLNTPPQSASDTGTIGEIRITAEYIYVCTKTNTWVRSPLSTW